MCLADELLCIPGPRRFPARDSPPAAREEGALFMLMCAAKKEVLIVCGNQCKGREWEMLLHRAGDWLWDRASRPDHCRRRRQRTKRVVNELRIPVITHECGTRLRRVTWTCSARTVSYSATPGSRHHRETCTRRRIVVRVRPIRLFIILEYYTNCCYYFSGRCRIHIHGGLPSVHMSFVACDPPGNDDGSEAKRKHPDVY